MSISVTPRSGVPVVGSGVEDAALEALMAPAPADATVATPVAVPVVPASAQLGVYQRAPMTLAGGPGVELVVVPTGLTSVSMLPLASYV